jgi:hypothetical protein
MFFTLKQLVALFAGSLMTIVSIIIWNEIGTNSFFELNQTTGKGGFFSFATFFFLGILVLLIGIVDVFKSLYFAIVARRKKRKE